MSLSNCRGCPLLALGCQDRIIYLLNATSLTVLHKIFVSLKPESLELPNYHVKCSEKSYFDLFCVDSLLNCFDNSFLVGLSTGFVKQYSLQSYEEIKTYNPIPLEYTPKENEKMTVSIENAFISGIESILYSSLSELIFVNHKRVFTNCLNRSFTLQETPISIYKRSGEATRRLKVQGDILAAKVLENRNLYLCLTSIESQLYIFNFVKGTLLRITLDFMKDPKMPLRFTGITTLEFELTERFRTTDKVIHSGASAKEVIDGDIIFGLENNGSILISKLVYETDETKISWNPIKFINARGNDKSLKESIQKNIHSKEISCLSYSKVQDKLFFGGPADEVIVLSEVLKKTFANGATQDTKDTTGNTQ